MKTRIFLLYAASLLWAAIASAQVGNNTVSSSLLNNVAVPVSNNNVPGHNNAATVPGAAFAAGGDPLPAGAEYYNATMGNELLVYPNPVVAGTARVVLQGAALDVVDLSVVDMVGVERLKYKYNPGSQVLFVDMHTLPEGLYSVRVSWAGARSYNLKVLKQ